MNYLKIYNALVLRAQSEHRLKTLDRIFENHHIIPACLGGSNTPDNMVNLTPREHFIAHVLLWKNDRTNNKLFAPLLFFKKNKHVKNARTYEVIRNQHILRMKMDNPSKHLSEESKKRKSEKLSFYASNRSPETRAKIGKKNKGKKKRAGAILKESTKNKIGKSLKEGYWSIEVNRLAQSVRM